MGQSPATTAPSLKQKVQAGLALQGRNLTAVCTQLGIDDSHIHKYFAGKVKSPKAKAAIAALIKEAEKSGMRIKQKGAK